MLQKYRIQTSTSWPYSNDIATGVPDQSLHKNHHHTTQYVQIHTVFYSKTLPITQSNKSYSSTNSLEISHTHPLHRTWKLCLMKELKLVIPKLQRHCSSKPSRTAKTSPPLTLKSPRMHHHTTHAGKKLLHATPNIPKNRTWQAWHAFCWCRWRADPERSPRCWRSSWDEAFEIDLGEEFVTTNVQWFRSKLMGSRCCSRRRLARVAIT